jgi:hypothetical protein
MNVIRSAICEKDTTQGTIVNGLVEIFNDGEFVGSAGFRYVCSTQTLSIGAGGIYANSGQGNVPGDFYVTSDVSL